MIEQIDRQLKSWLTQASQTEVMNAVPGNIQTQPAVGMYLLEIHQIKELLLILLEMKQA